MQTISGALATELNTPSQTVLPKVEAVFADSKYMSNLKVYSSGDWYSDIIPASTLIAWYRMGDVADTLNDWSGFGYDGDYFGSSHNVVNGIPSSYYITSGDGEKANQLGSSSYGRVTNAESDSALQLKDNFTVECWVKSTSAPTANETILAKGTDISNFSYRLIIEFGNSNKFAFEVWDNGGTYRKVQSSIATSTSAYRHVVVTRSGSNLSITVDGYNVNSISTLALGNLTTDPGDFAIGRLGSGNRDYFNGSVDEIALYSEVLSNDVLQQHYEVGRRETDIPASRQFNSPQAVNGMQRASMKWAVADALDQYGHTICCDQGYRVMDDGTFLLPAPYEYGWWSRRKSQSDTTFGSGDNELLWCYFDDRLANKVEVYTSEDYVPIKTYNIYYRSTGNAWVQIGSTQTMPSGQFVNSHDLGSEITIRGLKIEVLTVQIGGEPARVQELNPIFSRDISADVVTTKSTKLRDEFKSTVPVGMVSANTFEIELDNTELAYNAKGNGALAPYIRKGVKFTISYGWVLPDTSVEYLQQGIFYADTWKPDTTKMTVTVDCRDSSAPLQTNQQTGGVIVTDSTVIKGIVDLAEHGGIPRSDIIYVDTWFGTIVNDRPYAWWRMDDAIGTVLTDKLGISSGVINGSPSLAQPGALISDVNSFSTHFDGINDYISIGDTNNLDLRNSFTIEFWIKLFSSLSNDGTIVCKDATGSTTSGTYKVSITTAGEIKYETQSIDSVITSGASITNGSGWHHVAVTFDNSLGSNKLKIYIDSVLKGQGNVTNPTINALTLLIGRVGNNTTSNYLKAYLDETLLYKKALTSTQISKHYNAGKYPPQTVFPYLFSKDETIWDGMKSYATADMAMFYYDEFDKLNIESADHFYSTVDNTHTHHTVSQYNLSDATNIVSGDLTVEIQTNEVIVKMHPKSIVNIGRQAIWQAPDNASLAVLSIGTVTKGATIITPSSSVPLPQEWLPSGSFKIDNEVITYSGLTATSFTGCARGQYETKAQAHSSGLLREHRIYNVEYSSAPVLDVDYPLISAKDFDQTVDIDEFSPGAYTAVVRVSANTNNGPGDIVMLQGTNDVSGLNYYFVIAGIPITEQSSGGQVTQSSEVNSDSFRRFGEEKLEINNDFIQDSAQADKIASFLISHYENPVPILELHTLGIPQLQLGDRLTITNFTELSITNQDYWIIGHEIDYNGGVDQILTLREVS